MKNLTFALGIELHDIYLSNVITRWPLSLISGLSKIGGYLSLFSIASILLRLVHFKLSERQLGVMVDNKYCKSGKNLKGKDGSINRKPIEE